MNEYLPTKTNLMRLQAAIKLSKQGQELLERKRMILLKEKEKYEDRAKILREEVNNLFKQAYMLLQEASMDMGVDRIDEISKNISIDESVDIKYTVLMN